MFKKYRILIRILSRIFKYFDIPRILENDNGSNCTGSEFFHDNIQHVTRAGHHQSNGKAEGIISFFKFIMSSTFASGTQHLTRCSARLCTSDFRCSVNTTNFELCWPLQHTASGEPFIIRIERTLTMIE